MGSSQDQKNYFRKYLKLGTLLCLTINLHACTYKFIMADRSLRKVKYVEVSNNFYLFGLIGSDKIKVYKVCGNDRLYKLDDDQTRGQLLTTIFTVGLFQPRTVGITCGEPTPVPKSKTAALDIDEPHAL
ncbi:MAG: hypothetical protein NTY08_06135 [Proteobacteria bacterium]|nr:hypothetical protein [Pseudomonadota bacterium]